MNTKRIFPLFLLALIGTTTMSHAASDAMQGTSTETITMDAKEDSAVTHEEVVLPSGMVKAVSPCTLENIAFLLDATYLVVSLIFSGLFAFGAYWVVVSLLLLLPLELGFDDEDKVPFGGLTETTWSAWFVFFFVALIWLVKYGTMVWRLHKMGWIGNRLMGIRTVGKDGKNIGYFKTLLRGLVKFVTADGAVEYMLGKRPMYERIFSTSTIEKK